MQHNPQLWVPRQACYSVNRIVSKLSNVVFHFFSEGAKMEDSRISRFPTTLPGTIQNPININLSKALTVVVTAGQFHIPTWSILQSSHPGNCFF